MSSDNTFGAAIGLIGIFLAILGSCIALFTFSPTPIWVDLAVTTILMFTFIALVLMQDVNHRTSLQTLFAEPNGRSIYRKIVMYFLTPLWNSIGDPVGKEASAPRMIWAAATWRNYDWALSLAVVYPISAMLGAWIFGLPGQIGNVTVLEPAAFWPDRVAAIGSIAIILSGVLIQWRGARSPNGSIRTYSGYAGAFAFAVAFAFAFAGVFAVAFAFAIAVAVAVAYAGAFAVASAIAGAYAFAVAGAYAGAYAFAFAVAFAVASAGAYAFAFAVAFAVASAGAVDYLDQRNKSALARQLLTPFLFILILGATSFIPWDDVNDRSKGFFLFLGVFPLINALFDFTSYSITLGLLRFGLRLRGPLPFLIGLFDLAIALLLFLALGAALVCTIALLNTLADVPLLDLGALLAGVRETPQEYIWLYLMLFSTIVPTAIHFLFGLFSLQSWFAVVPALPKRIAKMIKHSPSSTTAATFAPFVIGIIWAVPFLLAGFGLWGVYLYCADGFAAFGGWYLTQMLSLAQWVEAI